MLLLEDPSSFNPSACLLFSALELMCPRRSTPILLFPVLNNNSKMQETYLFRAAFSELRTEILNARKASTNKMATQRAHLQHEVDILSQKASQEALTLKDDLRGMLNDRRMDVRMEQQARDVAIQELNYKITVALNSDSKSEVEGLRWVLTRRAALAIAGMAREFFNFPISRLPLLPLFTPSSIFPSFPLVMGSSDLALFHSLLFL